MALLSPEGNIEFLCLPRPDAGTVFGALLDRAAGHFQIRPADPTAVSRMEYEPDTMTLLTTWRTRTGVLEVRDVLATRGGEHVFTADHLLTRYIRCTAGCVDLRMVCEPRPDYGRQSVAWEGNESGVQRATTNDPSVPSLRLRTDLLTVLDTSRRGVLSGARILSSGEDAFVALAWLDGTLPRTAAEARAACEATGRGWAVWARECRFAGASDLCTITSLRRDALTLEGLRFEKTGAILAAPTFSVPEVLGGSRNWDYRYTWWRDGSMEAVALANAGHPQALHEFLRFAVRTIKPTEITALPVMVRVDGGHDLAEITLNHLAGYGADVNGQGGARPVRIGNGAAGQRQNDIPGWMVEAIAVHVGKHGQLSDELWELTKAFVEEARANWHLPDHGIWEVLAEPRHFVSSKLLSWVALDRGADLATSKGDHQRAKAWRAEAAAIHADICRQGIEKGVFRQSYGSKELDASALLMAVFGFLPARDPRLQATVRAIDRELHVNGGVERYRVEANVDGLGGQDEGTFAICSFWLVHALAVIGEGGKARRLFDELQAQRGAGGLYAEEIDGRTGSALGNIPQGYSHLGAMGATAALAQLERGPVHRTTPPCGEVTV